MNYLSELKRRNIFKVAVAYMALAWVMLQIADVVVPALKLPETIISGMIVIGLIGFPFALFFAWAFELTPEGIKRTIEVTEEESIAQETSQKLTYIIIGLLVFAVLFLLFDRNTTDGNGDTSGSIAVLSFVDMSASKDQEYFSDGLSEELLNVLAQIPDLKVAGRTSSFAYKGKNIDLREIGKALSVEHILEGSVRKQDNQVRITAQLIRANDGFHLWSETYDRELSDIFQVQEEIANSIVSNMALSIDLELTPTLVTTRTDNMDVYDLYLEGKMLIAKRGVENLSRALELLNEATQLDPSYSPAWGLLAQAHTIAYYYPEVESTADGMRLGEQAAQRALSIDPNSSLAHAAFGDILKDQFLWAAAEEQYQLALQSFPQNVEANEQYGQLLQRSSRFSESLPYVTKARTLDPLGPVYTMVEGMVRFVLGDKSRGMELLDRALSLSKNTSRFPPTQRFLFGLGTDNIQQSKELLTMALVHTEVENPQFLNRKLPNMLNDRNLLKSWLLDARNHFLDTPEDLNIEHGFGGVIFSSIAAYIGEYQLALDFIEIESKLPIEYANHDSLSSYWAPVYAPLQSDPRFKEIRDRYRLVGYWRSNGWADYCRPVGDDDFECGATQ